MTGERTKDTGLPYGPQFSPERSFQITAKKTYSPMSTAQIASLKKLQNEGKAIDRLPFSIRILLENALRNHDGFAITDEHLQTLINWKPEGIDKEIPYKPARVLMQDFTGVPSVVDIASLRSEAIRKGRDGSRINPAIPVDLVIDHSVQVDFFGTNYAFEKNVAYEYERNKERYQLLKWAQQGLDNFTVVPPGMGICHQVNLEYLAKGIIERDGWIFPDTLVGTDSHTPMVNGIGVLGWGVGGIEAEAAMLGQPSSMLIPQVVGFKLTGKLNEGVTATDLVLTVTQMLRKLGVVGKFVEFFGNGLKHLPLADRATIGNMAPEYGATCGIFPIDQEAINYLRLSGRSEEQIRLVEAYARAQGMWHDENSVTPEFTTTLELNLAEVRPSMAGPKRPQDRVLLEGVKQSFHDVVGPLTASRKSGSGSVGVTKDGENFTLKDGSVVIAAITSCTNTSNPAVML